MYTRALYTAWYVQCTAYSNTYIYIYIYTVKVIYMYIHIFTYIYIYICVYMYIVCKILYAGISKVVVGMWHMFGPSRAS